MSALGRTFLQKKSTNKNEHGDLAARTPHSRNYKLARPNLASFLPRNCQISTRIFNWERGLKVRGTNNVTDDDLEACLVLCIMIIIRKFAWCYMRACNMYHINHSNVFIHVDNLYDVTGKAACFNGPPFIALYNIDYTQE